MKKNIIPAAMIVLVIIACTIFMSDGFAYLIASLMALVIMGTIRRNQSRVMKMTRWAKAHPRKTQVIITILQIVLMALGIFAGYNLKKSGYELSGTTAFVFSTILFTGFLSVRFLPKRSTIAIPKVVNRNRFVYICIALSSFVLMARFGNRIEDIYPNSPITHAVQKIDQAIFPDQGVQYADFDDEASAPDFRKNDGNTLTDHSSSMAIFAVYTVNDNKTIKPPTGLKKETKARLKTEKKLKKLEKKKGRIMNFLRKHRLAFAAGISVGAVLLIILLGILTCAGICMIIGGFSEGNAGFIPLGVLVAGGSIWGIIKLSKGNKRKNGTE